MHDHNLHLSLCPFGTALMRCIGPTKSGAVRVSMSRQVFLTQLLAVHEPQASAQDACIKLL